MRSLRFSVRGQLLFIRGGHLRLPLQHPSGEGRHGTILHCLPGPDHQIEKSSWGSRLCAALSECTDRTPGYGWRDGSGRRCFGRCRNASWQFSFCNQAGPAGGQAFEQGVGHLGCDFRSPAAVFLKAGGGGSVGRIGDGANGEEWDAVCMADMGNGRGFHIRAKGVKCGPHGLCPRAREKGFSGHHPPEADGAAGVLGRLGGQGEQEGVPGNQMESIQGWNSVRISSATS